MTKQLLIGKLYGIQIETHIETFLSPKEYLQELQRFGIKITVVFVTQSEAVDILCTAYLNGWIIFGFSLISVNLRPSTIIVKLKLSIML